MTDNVVIINVVTIREFQQKLCHFIHQKKDVVVTSKGKELFVVTFDVVTFLKCRNNAKAILQFLEATTKNIPKDTTTSTIDVKDENPNVSIPPPKCMLCLACLRMGKTRQAEGEFEVTFENGERKVPLCEAHKKRLVNA